MPENRAGPGGRVGGGESPPGAALPIEALAEDARSLTPEAFEARHGSGFLMVSAAGGRASKGSTSTHLYLEGEDGDPGARTANLAVVVYPLQPKASSDEHLVTIGRETRHDVVIPDPSVSRFHAFAKSVGDGTFLLQDMGSTNGTSVNGVSVPPRGAGPPTSVKPGDTVRVGQVEFTFTDARALHEFALQVGG
ncbi:MAG: FHA domain-containing protein [Myxococcales bacterium]|nr:FHA domain-containing protein [Myxococcales bacterium]